jgi:hypothetical protein
VLYNFCSVQNCTDGGYPGNAEGVAIDPNGNLVGVTPVGGIECSSAGVEGCGVLFRITPNGTSSQEMVLHTFCSLSNCADGGFPEGGVVVDSTGNIFGTTWYGGDLKHTRNGGGALFEYSGSTYSVVHDFCMSRTFYCVDGAAPSRVFVDGSGTIFGTTDDGGSDTEPGGGTVFRVLP